MHGFADKPLRMPETIVGLFWTAVGAILVGATRSGSAGGQLGFRLAILPGAVTLWPLLDWSA